MNKFIIPSLEDEQQSNIHTFIEFNQSYLEIINKAENGNLSYELELLNKVKNILNNDNYLNLDKQIVNDSQDIIQLLSKYRDSVEEIIDINRKRGKWEDF